MSGEEQERLPRNSEEERRFRPVPRISSGGQHLDAGDAEQAPLPAPTRFAPGMARSSTVGTALTLAPSDENTDPLSWTTVNADEFVGNVTALPEQARVTMSAPCCSTSDLSCAMSVTASVGSGMTQQREPIAQAVA